MVRSHDTLVHWHLEELTIVFDGIHATGVGSTTGVGTTTNMKHLVAIHFLH